MRPNDGRRRVGIRGVFDQTLDEARLSVLVVNFLQVFSENFNLARLFLDGLVRGLALDDVRCRSSRCTRLSRALGFQDLGERSAGPHRAQVVVRVRAQKIVELQSDNLPQQRLEDRVRRRSRALGRKAHRKTSWYLLLGTLQSFSRRMISRSTQGYQMP